MIPFPGAEPLVMATYTQTKYRLEGPWQKVRSQLATLESSDSNAEKHSGSGKTVMGWGCGIGFLGLFLSFVTGPVGGILCFVSFSVAILAAIYSSFYQRYDLENMRYQLPTSLLDTLAVDLDVSKDVSVMVDFRASQSRQFVQKVEQDKFLFFSYGPKVTHFSHLWMELSAITVDGYKLKLSISREGTYKEVPKRKRTKTKLRYVDAVTVSVRPPADHPQPAAGAALTPPSCQRFRSFRGQLTAQGAVAKAVGPHFSRVENRGSSSYGDHLCGGDLVILLLACFRGLRGT